MNESELVQQLKSGNKATFSEFVAIYQKIVINICYRFLLNREDAEDVSQEVFIEAYHSIKNFRGDSKLSTWLIRIATSKSLDEIKRQNRKKRISSIGKTLGIDKIKNRISGYDRPDKILEDEESYDLLMKALNRLPENQHIAITLSKIEGSSNPEVAEIMQTSITAVESLIYRAKLNLKTFLNR
jgi:RNA polymerase sigma-70 factor, ECF subfamily